MKITLKDFLSLCVFKEDHDCDTEDMEKEWALDTKKVRIYYDSENENKWFEFGVNNWMASPTKEDIIKEVISPTILNRNVIQIETKNLYEPIMCIYLENDSHVLNK